MLNCDSGSGGGRGLPSLARPASHCVQTPASTSSLTQTSYEELTSKVQLRVLFIIVIFHCFRYTACIMLNWKWMSCESSYNLWSFRQWSTQCKCYTQLGVPTLGDVATPPVHPNYQTITHSTVTNTPSTISAQTNWDCNTWTFLQSAVYRNYST